MHVIILFKPLYTEIYVWKLFTERHVKIVNLSLLLILKLHSDNWNSDQNTHFYAPKECKLNL